MVVLLMAAVGEDFHHVSFADVVFAVVGVDWRHKLETQRGAVLATELKNNANKLAKWTAAALVSGVEIIKLGYVSRVHQRDTRHHVILGTQVGRYILPLYMYVPPIYRYLPLLVYMYVFIHIQGEATRTYVYMPMVMLLDMGYL